MTIIATSDSTFQADVLTLEKPVIVDFWAEWCGPCKMLSPILEEVALELAGKVEVRKMNVDDNQEIPSQLGIRGLPTLMLFREGKPMSTLVGLNSKTKILTWVQNSLS